MSVHARSASLSSVTKGRRICGSRTNDIFATGSAMNGVVIREQLSTPNFNRASEYAETKSSLASFAHCEGIRARRQRRITPDDTATRLRRQKIKRRLIRAEMDRKINADPYRDIPVPRPVYGSQKSARLRLECYFASVAPSRSIVASAGINENMRKNASRICRRIQIASPNFERENATRRRRGILSRSSVINFAR